jgi:nucleotide-binding universal stress UspA family protein
MFRKIIWATDGSADADRALPFATELAKLSGAEILAVHADEHFAGGRSSGEPVLTDEPELVAKIRGQVTRLRKDGFTAALELVHGVDRAADQIAEIARETGADAIVVGTRGRGPIAGALLGSITQQLLHDAPCPVLVVPTGARVWSEAEATPV